MEYRKLGVTDLDVSLICLGTMTWGNQNSEAEGHEQMDYAFEQGINFFDTAEMYAVPPSAETYGRTEEIIGSWFAKTGKRDKVVLATKVAGPGLPWVRGGNYHIDGPNIREALEASLKRLQTDYVDLYQLHWPNRGHYHFSRYWHYNPEFDPEAVKDNMREVLKTLSELIDEGKIRHVGLSNETAWGIMQYLQLSSAEGFPRMQSVQNEYSLLCRHFEPDLTEIAMAEKCGLLAWSPLATGMLSGKYLDGARPPGARWTIGSPVQDRDTPHAHSAVRAYMDIADRYGLDVCQMALAYVNSRPFVTADIIGATSMEQLKSNIASVNVKLSEDVLDAIDNVRRDFPIPY